MGVGFERETRGARVAFAFYRALGRALRPGLLPWLALRARRGKEERGRLGERLGRITEPRPDGPLVWLHAASVGELNSILPLAGALHERGLASLVTTGTVTSARIARERLPEGAIHQFQPLDVEPAVAPFLDHWRPDLAIFAESEVWPVTIHALHRRGVHQLMVNGRLSDRSFGRWAKRPGLAASLFSRLSHVAAQSELDAERFRALGASRVVATGNLKADAVAPEADGSELAKLKSAVGERPVWVAASIHPAEDAALMDAVAALIARRPDALSIVVPRHPDRGAELQAALLARGFRVARRSKGEAVADDTQVLLADTMGEMGLWYRLATVAFMGRSIAGAEGGQNPLEPVLCGAAVLSGRAVANFREPYRRLLLDGGARLVDDASMLADFVARLWDDADARAAMQAGGERTIEHMSGALERTLASLEPWLAPLRMQAMLEQTRAASEGHMAGLSSARLRAMREAEIRGRGEASAPGLAAAGE